MADIEIDTKPLLYDVLVEDYDTGNYICSLVLPYVPTTGDIVVIRDAQPRGERIREWGMRPHVQYTVRARIWDTSVDADELPSVELRVTRVEEG